MENKEALTFEFFHNVKADRSTKTIIVEAGAHILTVEGHIILAEDIVRAEFSIVPFDEVVKQEDDNAFQTTVPQLVDTFINVTLGALRGIFAKNLSGTYLDGIVLPLIPMNVISDSHKRNAQKK